MKTTDPIRQASGSLNDDRDALVSERWLRTLARTDIGAERSPTIQRSGAGGPN